MPAATCTLCQHTIHPPTAAYHFAKTNSTQQRITACHPQCQHPPPQQPVNDSSSLITIVSRRQLLQNTAALFPTIRPSLAAVELALTTTRSCKQKSRTMLLPTMHLVDDYYILEEVVEHLNSCEAVVLSLNEKIVEKRMRKEKEANKKQTRSKKKNASKSTEETAPALPLDHNSLAADQYQFLRALRRGDLRTSLTGK